MEHPAAVKVNRRRQPKSRNGCNRCKTRRLKCDEAKPVCLQCSKKGYACPGYAQKPLQWSTKHEVLHRNIQTTQQKSRRNQLSRTSKIKLHDRQSDERSNCVEDDVLHLPDVQTSISQTEEGYDGFPLTGSRSPSLFEDQILQFSMPSPQPPNAVAINLLELSGSFLTPASPLSSGKCFSQSLPHYRDLEAIRQRLQRSQVPEFLIHLPTILVDHYFDHVCNVFSVFDCSSNPFRSTVGRMWDGCATLYYTIQSMAAAFLANDFPHMRQVGVSLQQEAYKHLQEESYMERQSQGGNDKILLTILMLGLTTGWHKSNDLGLTQQKAARRLLQRRLQQQGPNVDQQVHRENQFFEQCLLYWKMLTAFVVDASEFDALETSEIEIHSPIAASVPTACKEEPDDVLLFPHPWTGVVPKVQSLFAEVGALIRQTRISFHPSTTSVDLFTLSPGPHVTISVRTLDETLESAQRLEEELLSFECPSAHNLVDPGDERTPLDHFLKIGESYRSAALLLIYKVWPSILRKRLPLEQSNDETDEWDSLFSHFPQSEITSDQLGARKWISSLAMYIIGLLKDLPATSGTRFLQPILLVTAANELQFSTSEIYFRSNIDIDQIDIASARRFVVTRMNELQNALPSKPVEQVHKVIKETWERLDNGIDTFWVDVMIENGWETIMG